MKVRPLTPDAFAPFGDVIAIETAKKQITINNGMAERYHDLATIDTLANDGRTIVNIFRAKPRALPLPITLVERHPLGSQAFMPLHGRPFLIVVASSSLDEPSPNDLHMFFTNGAQGVNYARGLWHSPLLCFAEAQDFFVVDRGGDGRNLDEITFASPPVVTAAMLPAALYQ